jgi:hypothetical protein
MMTAQFKVVYGLAFCLLNDTTGTIRWQEPAANGRRIVRRVTEPDTRFRMFQNSETYYRAAWLNALAAGAVTEKQRIKDFGNEDERNLWFSMTWNSYRSTRDSKYPSLTELARFKVTHEEAKKLYAAACAKTDEAMRTLPRGEERDILLMKFAGQSSRLSAPRRCLGRNEISPRAPPPPFPFQTGG